MKTLTKLAKALSILGLSAILAACTTKTSENTQRSIKDFPQGEQMRVEMTQVHQEQVGMLSKVVYQTKDRHQYQLSFTPNDIEWQNGDGEPKQLLVCADGNAYLHFVNQIPNPFYSTPPTNPAEPVPEPAKIENPEPKPVVQPYFILKNQYVRWVDKRYFFKLLGESYWADVSQDEYKNKVAQCKAYEVPNDGYYQAAVE